MWWRLCSTHSSDFADDDRLNQILIKPNHLLRYGLYATRTQTVVLVTRREGRVRWVERDAYALESDAAGEVEQQAAAWSGKLREYEFVLGQTKYS